MNRKNRCLAVFVAVSMLFVVLFSLSFLAGRSGHHCPERCGRRECPVCASVSAVKNGLNGVSSAAVLYGFVFILLFIGCRISYARSCAFLFNNPVELKVKLLN